MKKTFKTLKGEERDNNVADQFEDEVDADIAMADNEVMGKKLC